MLVRHVLTSLGLVLVTGAMASCSSSPPGSETLGPDGSVAEGGTSPDGATGPKPPGIDIYDPATIPDIAITLDPAAIAVLSKPGGTNTNRAPDRKDWVHGSVTIGGRTFEDVGVRRKGASTFRSLPKKASLKIKFDKYQKGQTFDGLSDLTLNNMVSDKTGIAERLGYHVFREAGLPAGRSNHAHVTINGEDYGVYSNVESANEQYLARVFPKNPITTMYEADGGSQWTPGVESDFEVKLGPDDQGDLKKLFAAVAAAKTETLLADVAPRLDTAQWLKYSAAEALIGDLDGYGFGIYGSHNYFLAGNANATFSILPWSLDLAFTDEDTIVDANVPLHSDPGPPPSGVTLLMRCKASTACWGEYKKAMQELLVVWDKLGLEAVAKTYTTQIDGLLRADPKREYSIPALDSANAKLGPWIRNQPARIKRQLGI